ncbi:MAG: DUF2442 domain-containing protein [Chitinophagales bacterium]|nr:DUF2442 domain-containing protein [Chitinophagales bacterium]
MPTLLSRSGKNISVLNDPVMLAALNIRFEARNMFIELNDGRIVSASVDNYPNLSKGTPEQWKKYELWNEGQWIHWEELDEDLSVEGFLKMDNEAA